MHPNSKVIVIRRKTSWFARYVSGFFCSLIFGLDALEQGPNHGVMDRAYSGQQHLVVTSHWYHPMGYITERKEN